LILSQSEDQGCRTILISVVGDDGEIVLSALEWQITEGIKLEPVISRANLLTIEIGSEIVVSSYAQLGRGLWTIGLENALEDNFIAIRPAISAACNIDPFGSRHSRVVEMVYVVIFLVSHS